MATEPDEIERIVREAILERMRRSQRLADTLEGIASWWLGQAGVEVAPERLEQLLQKLVEEGVLVSYMLPNGAMLYGSPGLASDYRDATEIEQDVSGHSRDE